eukprot:2268410-Rhodomonas_salina.2
MARRMAVSDGLSRARAELSQTCQRARRPGADAARARCSSTGYTVRFSVKYLTNTMLMLSDGTLAYWDSYLRDEIAALMGESGPGSLLTAPTFCRLAGLGYTQDTDRNTLGGRVWRVLPGADRACACICRQVSLRAAPPTSRPR